MEKNKVSTFVKKYKWALINGTVAAGLVGVSYFLGRQVAFRQVLNEIDKEISRRNAMPGFTIKDQLTVGDLGKLGEEYIKHDNTLTASTKVLRVGTIEFE